MEVLRSEIRRFLRSPTPDVLCLTGRWGTGKTYLWKQIVKEVGHSGEVALERYSYVSLYGLESLDEVKQAIFANSQKTDAIVDDPTMETLAENAKHLTEKVESTSANWVVAKLAKLVPAVPYLSALANSTGSLFYFFTRSQIICFDDFERMSKKIEPHVLLGLITQLKEQKDCKVVLVLNDGQLESIGAHSSFSRLAEKVIDVSLECAPSPCMCAEVGLRDDIRCRSEIMKFCKNLEISNIRIVQKIGRHIEAIEESLSGFRDEIFASVAKSIVLFTWMKFDEGDVPTEEFLQRGFSMAFYVASRKDGTSAEETRWHDRLSAYGFSGMNKLSQAILDGVNAGYFDISAVTSFAEDLRKRTGEQASRDEFDALWAEFGSSFGGDEGVFTSKLLDVFSRNIADLGPAALNRAIVFLREMDLNSKASELMELYIKVHAAVDPEVFDLDRGFLPEDISDSELVDAFADAYKAQKKPKTDYEVLMHIAEHIDAGWDDYSLLTKINARTYQKVFLELEGRKRNMLINWCLERGRFVNASDEMKQVTKLAKDALKAIGSRSTFDAAKVRRFGIES